MNKVITIKTDEETKLAAQQLASDVGMTLSSLVNSYLKQVIATRHIDIYAPEQMTPKLEKMIGEVEKEIEAGETSGPFATAEDAIKHLKSL